MEDIFVARQPIYNRQLDVIGYELLFRANDSGSAQFADGARASSQLISNTFMGIGLENIVGSSPAFINLTHDFFVDDRPIPMSPEQVVLEVHEERLPEQKVLHGLQQLAKEGYAIALDDFSYLPELEPLLELASYVKLDLGMHNEAQLREQIIHCRRHDIKLLAEKVETPEDLALCRELGFDYFQGYFFCKPQTVHGRSEPSNRGVLLELLKLLQQAETDMQTLEKVLVQDVALSYKLLRYINCANYAIRREVDSVRDALMLLGTQTVKKWAVLLLMSSSDGDKPRELLTTAMVRARMCELLAQKHDNLKPEQAFTVGLFSALDAVMDMPMEELLDTVSLSSTIKFALLSHEGELGELLEQVLRYERGEWSALGSTHFPPGEFAPRYLHAIQWANESSAALES
jgi:EAL and modified HD-GYP domain-containing signal transduction protein